MIPVDCQVKHNPPFSYGDCLRACVASIMEMMPEYVPHFCAHGEDVEETWNNMRRWLRLRGLAPFIFALPGDMILLEVCEHISAQNPDTYYLVFGKQGKGDHVVVCADKPVHDPGWGGVFLDGPTDAGQWLIMLIVRS